MTEIEKLIERINKEAEGEIVEECDPEFDYTFGGNFDDAYSAGIDDGYIMLARELKNILEGKV